MKKVIPAAALSIALAVLNVGCATTSRRQFHHSDNEVVTAMLETEEATFARLRASSNCEVAEAARLIAEQDRVR